MSFTIVTSYVNFYRTPISNHVPRLQQLQKLVKTGLPIIIFVSPDTADIVKQHQHTGKGADTNVRIIPLPSSFFESSKFYSTAAHSLPLRTLPEHRLQPKDTFDYMCYLHAKVEYMMEATKRNPFRTDFFAWCDYDVMKNYNTSRTLRHIHANGLCASDSKHHIYFPGCWERKMNDKVETERVCWRFCGGFFLGTTEAIVHLYSLYAAFFATFLETHKTMVWDVNFWAYLELEKDWRPLVYKADHDASLIDNFPLRGYAHKMIVQKSEEYVYPELAAANYAPSSSSYFMWNDRPLLNIRYVNYRYLPSGHCQLQSDRKVCTKNVLAFLNTTTTTTEFTSYHMIEGIDLPVPDPNEQYQGIEDIRLYQHKGALKFVATTVNYSGCATNRMVYGDYDIHDFCLKNVRVMGPPTPKIEDEEGKEKNWIPFESRKEPDREYFVYSWAPLFQMGVMDNEEGRLEITHTYSTTLLFPYNNRMIKGSSNILYDVLTRSYVTVVHICEEGSLPKEYYHMLVWLDPDTYQPTGYSKLFYFDIHGPEFCLSMKATKDQFIFWISRLDRDPITLYCDKQNLPKN